VGTSPTAATNDTSVKKVTNAAKTSVAAKNAPSGAVKNGAMSTIKELSGVNTQASNQKGIKANSTLSKDLASPNSKSHPNLVFVQQPTNSALNIIGSPSLDPAKGSLGASPVKLSSKVYQ
jgi:hypothetical protein